MSEIDRFEIDLAFFFPVFVCVRVLHGLLIAMVVGGEEGNVVVRA